MEEIHTFSQLLDRIESNEPNPAALNYRDGTVWKPISTEEMLDSIKYLALGLHQLGMQKGDRVGILAPSSPYWAIADLAIIIAGGISVPIFANVSDENFIYEVSETKLRIIFVEGDEQLSSCQRHKEYFDVVIGLSSSKMGDVSQNHKMISLEEVMKLGQELEEKRPSLYEQLRESAKPDEVAAIIYTSGSTGIPKGVMLTQQNLTAALHFDKYNLDPKKDSYLSVLPLAHVFGHGINLWAIVWGLRVYYTNDYKNLGTIFREVRPTVTVVVPRLLEKVYNKMAETVHSGSFLKRTIGNWAFSLARKEDDSLSKRLFHWLAEWLVYRKLREALGGCLHTVLSGGAALNPRLHKFFHGIGVPIYEGWGLTEACPVCVNIPAKNKIGTVGPLMIDQLLMITQEGEVLVKGSLVMKGYYLKPEETANTIDKNMWLHTGDRGTIDSDGYLTLLGRMKELYKTSTGEYVAPVPIEQALSHFSLIDMSMVVAEGRKFTSCLLFPNFEAVARIKAEQRLNKMSDEEFLHSNYIRKEMNKFIENINQHLNRAEQIQAYRFVMEPLTIEGGELTPSMKIRRGIVAKKYSSLIDSMYPEEES